MLFFIDKVMELEHLKFPIGQFIKPDCITPNHLTEWINDFEQFPKRLNAILKTLPPEALHWQYRPEGWSILQVVHHCADSHINSMIRFKLALTEDNPTIRPYYEDRWALLADYTEDNLEEALMILKGIHAKLTTLFKQFTAEDLKRTFIHPEHNQQVTLEENIGIYAWHSNHHLAHIKQAVEYMGSFDD